MSSSESTAPSGSDLAQLPPPPQPPPAKGGAPGGLTRGGLIAWLLALTLLMLPMGITFVRESASHETAYGSGAALGTGFVILVVAAVGQTLYRRATSRSKPAPLQAFIAIAAIAAIGVQYVWRAADAGSAQTALTAAVADCRASDPEAFGGAPRGTALVPPPPDRRAALDERLAGGELPAGMQPSDVAAAEIVDPTAGVRGVAIGVPGLNELEGGAAGFQAGIVGQSGAPLRWHLVQGARIGTGQTAAGAFALGENSCWTIVVLGRSEHEAVALARPLLPG